jgi:transcriptional regulator with XRE-family HTH domain
LQELRESADISRAALAVTMDRSEQAIWSWERGDNAPRADQLGHLAQLLGCSIDDFFAPVKSDDPPRKGGSSKNASGRTRNATKA